MRIDKIDFIWLAGTGFGAYPDVISKTFGACLDPDRFTFRCLPYPASYGMQGQPSYEESRKAGRRALLDAIRDTPNLVCVGGYSQGAGIAGDVAAEIARAMHPHMEVLACALIADPARPIGKGMPDWPVAPGYGITGQRPIPGISAWWAAAPRDPITSLPAGSPLRGLADTTRYYSLSSPGAAQEWMEGLKKTALENKWQAWWDIRNAWSWGGAVRDATAYLSGRHGIDYIDRGYVQHLAGIVNAEVWI